MRQLVSSNSFLSLGWFWLFFLGDIIHACISTSSSLCASSWVHVLEPLQFEFFLLLLCINNALQFVLDCVVSMDLRVSHPDPGQTSVRGLLHSELDWYLNFLPFASKLRTCFEGGSLILRRSRCG